VVLLISVISHTTNLLMFLMAAWQVRSMKHWVVIILCNGHNLCETVTTAVGESWNLVLLSVTVEATWFANVLSVARCVTRFDVSLTCHAVFEKIPGHVTWQITMSGLSHGHKCLPGLLWWTAGRNDNTRNCLFVSSIAFLLCYKKKNKQNLVDLVPACRVVFTPLRVEVFLLLLINIPTLKSWFVYMLRHPWWRHLSTLIWPFAPKRRWHSEGGESLLPMPPRLYLNTS